MNPGVTICPDASTVTSANAASKRPIASILSPETPTSAGYADAPVPSTIVPLFISTSNNSRESFQRCTVVLKLNLRNSLLSKNCKLIAERFSYKCGQLHWTIIDHRHELTQRNSETAKPLPFGMALEHVLSVSKRGNDTCILSLGRLLCHPTPSRWVSGRTPQP